MTDGSLEPGAGSALLTSSWADLLLLLVKAGGRPVPAAPVSPEPFAATEFPSL